MVNITNYPISNVNGMWGVIVNFLIIGCSNSKYETKTGTNDQNIQHNFPLNCSPLLNFEYSVT